MRDALMLQPYSCSVLVNPSGKLFQGLLSVLKVTGTVLALGLILALTWLHAELSSQTREAISLHANSLEMRAFTDHSLSLLQTDWFPFKANQDDAHLPYSTQLKMQVYAFDLV